MSAGDLVSGEINHTELPWRVEEIDGRPVIRGGELNLIVAALILLIGPGQSSEANAEFIVRACNAHQALVDAIKQAVDKDLAYLDGEARGITHGDVQALREALRKAGVK